MILEILIGILFIMLLISVRDILEIEKKVIENNNDLLDKNIDRHLETKRNLDFVRQTEQAISVLTDYLGVDIKEREIDKVIQVNGLKVLKKSKKSKK